MVDATNAKKDIMYLLILYVCLNNLDVCMKMVNAHFVTTHLKCMNNLKNADLMVVLKLSLQVAINASILINLTKLKHAKYLIV